MSDLALVKSEEFDNRIECNFYSNDQREEVWMTRRQVGEALNYANPTVAIGKIHNRNKGRFDDKSRVTQIDLPSGGQQETTIYNRKGMMEICRHSRKEKADLFMDWVWEVIDEIMTTGSYSVEEKFDLPESYSEALRELASTVEENEKLKQENDKLRPKAKKYQEFLDEEGLMSMGQVAKMTGAIGRNNLYKLLREKDVLMAGNNHNEPYQKYVDRGYFVIRKPKIDHLDRRPTTTRVTPKGADFILEILTEEGYLEQPKLMRVK